MKYHVYIVEMMTIPQMIMKHTKEVWTIDTVVKI